MFNRLGFFFTKINIFHHFHPGPLNWEALIFLLLLVVHNIYLKALITDQLMFTSLNRDITSRTFSLDEFLSKHQEHLIPAGLCFFQASWDNSVTQSFEEVLGKTVKYKLRLNSEGSNIKKCFKKVRDKRQLVVVKV